MARPNQNRIDKQFTEHDLTNLDTALTSLEALVGDLPTPTPQDKARSAKPPEGAGDWITKMITMAGQNLGVLPASFSGESIQRDIDLTSQLNARKVRLEAIANKVNGAIFYGQSDVFAACLNIRKDLIDGGVPNVDNDLDEGMSSYFRRQRNTPAPATPQG